MSRRAAGPSLAHLVAAVGVGLVTFGAAACQKQPEAPRGARLSARWTGADTAAFSARAVAEWCVSLHLLEIRAVAGDTGVGIALYPPDTVGPGIYPIRRPDAADTTHPPYAALALRWFSKTTVMGYQGDSGSLTLERRPDGTLAGRFMAAARPLVAGRPLKATGAFHDLRVVPAPGDCAGPPADTAGAGTAPAGPARPDTTD